MQGTYLALLKRPACAVAQFVEVSQIGVLDEVLGMPEEIHDRDDTDSALRRLRNQEAKVLVRIGVIAADARKAGVINGVFKVKVEFLVSPLGIAGQQALQHVEALDLAGQIPLKGFDGRGGHVCQLRGDFVR